jgi:drug/metabolite transporter (DMT)-like permease
MSAVLALLAAAAYGAADFLGGLVSRRASTTGSVIVSQAFGLALLLLGSPLMAGAQVGRADVFWGAAAGLTGGIGVALLYRALAIGPMSLVAPVTAICAVLVPVAFGVAFGEDVTAMAWLGIAAAIVAVWLVAQEERAEEDGKGRPTMKVGRSTAADRPATGLRIALASGVAIGLFLVALERTAPAAGLWPLAVARVVSVTLFLGVAMATRQPMTVPRGAMPLALACGALDMAANALYVVAVQQGALGVVATLVSLYPASTVLLARLVLGERLSRLQLVGVACALAAVVLLVGGST